jgi:hypothetical protein
MPKIHREQGFSVRVCPADHLPPHVHLVKGGTGVKIRLAGPSGRHEIVAVYGMEEQDVVAAYRNVEGHHTEFLTAWKDCHGHPASD